MLRSITTQSFLHHDVSPRKPGTSAAYSSTQILPLLTQVRESKARRGPNYGSYGFINDTYGRAASLTTMQAPVVILEIFDLDLSDGLTERMVAWRLATLFDLV